MKHYTERTITIGGFLEQKVKMWDEHNHATVYRDSTQIYDGEYTRACYAFDEEVEKICKTAEKHGLTYQKGNEIHI